MDESEYYVALDIGSSTVKLLVGKVADDTVHVIGVTEVASKGIRKGTIIDIEATVKSIKQVIEEAERMMNVKVSEVVLGIPANDVQFQKAKGVVAINNDNREITDDELHRVIDSAQLMSVSPEREVLNIVPKQFIVDDYDEIKDPRGMLGIRLELEGTLITTSKTLLHNILRCVDKAGVQVREIYLQSLAAGTFALTEDEKNHGVAYVDIGGGITTVTVFKDNHIVGSSVIPVGGDNMTKDLSIILKTSTEEAKKIKYHYGHTYVEDALDDWIEVPVIDQDKHENISQKYVAEILSARMEELFDLIIDELYNMNVTDLPGGIILTGGATKVEGILHLARDVFQLRVRLHAPPYIGVRDPKYTTAVGLIQYAAKDDQFYNRSYVPAQDFKQTQQSTENQQSQSNFYEDEDFYDYDDEYEYEQEKKEKKEGLFSKTKKLFNNFFD